jgi:hypothetical protein
MVAVCVVELIEIAALTVETDEVSSVPMQVKDQVVTPATEARFTVAAEDAGQLTALVVAVEFTVQTGEA